MKEEEFWHPDELLAVQVVEVLQEPLDLVLSAFSSVEVALTPVAQHCGDEHLAVSEGDLKLPYNLAHLPVQQVLVNSDLGI